MSRKLLPLIAEAGVAAIANPLDQHHPPGPPRHLPASAAASPACRRCAAPGITVAFGHDCVMDPWYSLGSGDMLEVAHMAVHAVPDDQPRGDPPVLRRR